MAGTVCILYIEDSEFDRLSFKNTIGHIPEFKCEIAETLQEGQDKISKKDYDVIVSDFNLPDGNAFKILDLQTDAPVVILTGGGDEETAANLIKSGAKDYIIKDGFNNHFKILPVVIERVIKLAEAEKAQRTLTALVESAGDAIISVNLDGTIESWNGGAELIYGYSKKEIINKPFVRLCGENTYDEMLQDLDRVKVSHHTFFKEMEHVKKNGEKLFVYMSLSPIWNRKGCVGCISIIGRDITELKQKEKDLVKSQIELEKGKELELKKDQFIGVASHELKTPLTSVKAYIDLLELHAQKYNTGDKELFPIIQKSKIFIKKLELLINDLLDVSKIQTGRMNCIMKEFDVDEMIAQTIEGVQKLSEKHKIKVHQKVNTHIVADRDKLEEVLTNYLTNAIKYSPKVFEIVVNAEVKNDMLIVSVRDHGIGIDKKNLNHLFERYYRVEDVSLKFSGLGIGLFISKEIIKHHRGNVWVESDPGEGSTFFFAVPVKPLTDEIPGPSHPMHPQRK